MGCNFNKTIELTYSYGGHNPSLHEHAYYEDVIQISRCCILPAQWYIKTNEYLRINNIMDYLYKLPDKNSKTLYKNHPMCSGNACVLEPNKDIKDIIVGLSYACNLHCYHCWFDGLHKDTSLKKEVYFYTLYNIKNHNLNSITLTNKGEPFFYLDETLEYLRSLTINDTKIISTVTNGNCLTKKALDEINRIREETGINFVFLFSIDAITEATYNNSRPGGNFKKVLNNLELATKYFGKENVTVSFTCKRTNYGEVNKAKKYYMDNFGLSTNITFDYYEQDLSRYYIDL